MASQDPVVIELLERCRRDHHAWINGDGSGYALPADGTILGGIGGYGFGGPLTTERQAALARQWRSGIGEVELVNAAVQGDIAWLAMIERARVTIDPAGGEQRWDLRITEIFRRVDGRWERVHRHADPLVDRRSLDEVLALLA